jgi:hypothetical protein
MNKQLRATAVALTVLSTLSLATLDLAADATPAPGAAPSNDAKIARGAYLVTFGGCNDCHTPFKLGPNGPEPDMSRMLSGHPQQMVLPPPPAPNGPWLMSAAATNTAWAGPWGVSYTANLTPDAATGLGQWTEQEFVAAMRSGRHRGRGRQILPPMPWQGVGQATDEDLGAIFAFLRSIPAIANQVPEPVLAPMPAH